MTAPRQDGTRHDVPAVLVGVALMALVLATAFASGPRTRPTPKRRDVQIMRLTLLPQSSAPEAAPASAAHWRSSATLAIAASPAPPALPRAPAAPPDFAPGQALIPPQAIADASIAAGDQAAVYAYLTNLRRLLQSAIARDGRLHATHGLAESTAGLWLWIAPTGRLLRAEPPRASGGRSFTESKIEHVLTDVAINIDHLPAPPQGLPQPVEIGLDGAELGSGPSPEISRRIGF